MRSFEYAVVPVPRQVPRIKGVKGTEARFARGLTDLLNAWAAEGWEFQRTETLAVEDRGGLLGKTLTSQQTVLVFRREVSTDDEMADPRAYAEAAQTPEELAHDLTHPGPAAAEPRLTAKRGGPAELHPLPAPRARGGDR